MDPENKYLIFKAINQDQYQASYIDSYIQVNDVSAIKSEIEQKKDSDQYSNVDEKEEGSGNES